MPLPSFLAQLPELDLPFPSEVVTSRAIVSGDALMVFFSFHQDMELPAHSHGAQWGTVLQGEVTLTIEGETRTYKPGETYNIPAGAVHSAQVPAGTHVMDMFEEPDRYPIKPR